MQNGDLCICPVGNKGIDLSPLVTLWKGLKVKTRLSDKFGLIVNMDVSHNIL
jgi:hypothetical protein